MRRFARATLSVAVVLFFLSVGFVAPIAAQQPPSYWAASSHAQRVLDYYGGQSARATLEKMPRRTPIQPAQTEQMPHHGKPFQSATTSPTVSPYLNLFRDDDEVTESAPSYYAFVRPQLEQQQINERQQRELQRLERQLQRGSAVTAVRGVSSGSSARFMDTAQFYGGWRR